MTAAERAFEQWWEGIVVRGEKNVAELAYRAATRRAAAIARATPIAKVCADEREAIARAIEGE